ncbi:MAG: DUF4382 domain-containing protein [Bacteroidales bacterium]|jgi:hypothetical protein
MKTKFFPIVAIVLVAIFVIGCSKDGMQDALTGHVNFKMTDAPSDDANIKGTFITVSNVKIDGKAVSGFKKQTFDISAYQRGETKLLLSDDVEAKSYNTVTLELDYQQDASGKSPGCYVMTVDDNKHDLAVSSESKEEFTFNKSFKIDSNQSTDIVIDFDLRKSIKRNSDNPGSDYSFAGNAEMKSAFRVVLVSESGLIKGKINNSLTSNAELIVYAYKKDQYNQQTEAAGSENEMFTHAVTSARVNDEGTYQLSFLEQGNYEVHVASYSDTKSPGRLEFNGMANAISIISSILLNNIQVSANAEFKLDISILF